MVDLSLVLDVSGSIGWRWPVRERRRQNLRRCIRRDQDRVSLIFFSNGARVVDAMPAGRGFDKASVMADIPNTLPGGSTNMAEGIYRGWDELRSVPNGQQSGLRVIVLFTDGATNGVPGIFPGMATSRAMRTTDFPDRNDPDNQTNNSPTISGLYDTQSGVTVPSAIANQSVPLERRIAATYDCPVAASDELPFLPPKRRDPDVVSADDQHADGRWRSAECHGVRCGTRVGANVPPYRTTIFNINNAARNLVEYIANAARTDTAGDYPIRIYTIGMGELVRLQLGTRPETSESMLKRIANDLTLAGPQCRADRRQVLLRGNADDVGRRVPGVAEPDHPSDQVVHPAVLIRRR